jgi:predicted  nucleic acid-binding Zn-ribbon protein
VARVTEGLNQIIGEGWDQQKTMEVEIKTVRDELQELKNCITGGNGGHTDEVELKKLQKEMGEMKVEKESAVNSLVRNVKVDAEETLDVERRKCNLVLHGMP